MVKGIIIWGLFLAVLIGGLLYSRKMKKGIEENGVEADAVVSRISEDMTEDQTGFTIIYVRFKTQEGEEVEATISNPRSGLKEGDQVRIKYHPKFKNNARLV